MEAHDRVWNARRKETLLPYASLPLSHIRDQSFTRKMLLCVLLWQCAEQCKNEVLNIHLTQGALWQKIWFGSLKPHKFSVWNRCKLMLCPGTNCSCPGLKCHWRSDPELWPGQPNLPAHDDISTLIWELHKKRCFCDLLVLAAFIHQTPGQLGQEKTDAAVMEVSSPARERAAPEAQEDTGFKSSPRCKRKVCGDIGPGGGKGFYFLLILPPPACAGVAFAWKTFHC